MGKGLANPVGTLMRVDESKPPVFDAVEQVTADPQSTRRRRQG